MARWTLQRRRRHSAVMSMTDAGVSAGVRRGRDNRTTKVGMRKDIREQRLTQGVDGIGGTDLLSRNAWRQLEQPDVAEVDLRPFRLQAQIALLLRRLADAVDEDA